MADWSGDIILGMSSLTSWPRPLQYQYAELSRYTEHWTLNTLFADWTLRDLQIICTVISMGVGDRGKSVDSVDSGQFWHYLVNMTELE